MLFFLSFHSGVLLSFSCYLPIYVCFLNKVGLDLNIQSYTANEIHSRRLQSSDNTRLMDWYPIENPKSKNLVYNVTSLNIKLEYISGALPAEGFADERLTEPFASYIKECANSQVKYGKTHLKHKNLNTLSSRPRS